MAIYALVFFAMRVGISVFAFEDFSALRGDFVKIYASGFALDMSDFAIGASLFVLLGYVSGALYSLSLSLRFCEIARIFLYRFALIFATLTALVVSVMACVNFYYFKTYHTKIDIFIFGLKDDDTSAILSIIFNDYPIVLIFACLAIFCAFCVWLNNKILKSPPPLRI